MKNKITLAIIVILIGLFVFVEKSAENGEKPLLVTPGTMQIASQAFQNDGKIPSRYTCDAENISPDLEFSDVPEDAKSLVLISHDPDAPVQGGWTHWVVINMDTTSSGIGENSKPSSGLETETSFGKPGYGGPCPPSGSHHYYFYLYALDKTLELDENATKEDVEAAMEGHILETAELLGYYERQ